MLSQLTQINAKEASERLAIGEIGMLSSASLLAAFAGYLILSDFTFSARTLEDRGEPVATVVSSKNIVKRRPADYPLWDSVDTDQPLYLKDQIFTDKLSSVEFKFANSDVVQIDENSLVVINRSEEIPTLELKSGTLIAKSTSQISNFQIKVGETKTRLNEIGSSAILKAGTDGKTSIAVLSGNAELKNKDKSFTLQENQSSEFKKDGSKIENAAPVLIQPTRQQIFYQNQAMPVFRWSSHPLAQKYRLEIASSAAFANPILQQDVTKNIFKPQSLPLGTHYWRVASYNKKSTAWEYSIEQSFNVITETVPTLIWPPAGHEFTYYEKAKKSSNADLGLTTYLDWQMETDVDSFMVELAADPKFQKVLAREKTLAPPFETPALPGGKYYWRVKHDDTANPNTSWSRVGNFNVTTQFIPDAPVLASLGTVTVKEKFPRVALKWQGSDLATGYVVELAKTPEFSKADRIAAYKLKEGSESKIDWQSDRLGEIYWRVKPLDGSGRSTDFSEPASLNLVPDTLSLIAPTDQAVFKSFGGETEVNLNWSQQAGANAYRLQIAREATFSDSVFSKAIKGDQFTWATKERGTFYWRIQPNLPRYASNAPISIPQSFTISGVDLAAVAGLTPDNEILASAEATRSVSFDWQDVDKAKTYAIEIASDPEFKKIVKNKRIPLSDFQASLSYGNYHWRVRALPEKGNPGPWSESKNFQVEKVFPAPRMAPLLAVKTYSRDGGDAQINWPAVKNAAGYKLEIAKDPEFKQVVHQADGKVTNKTQRLANGDYYTRVAALNDRGSVGTWSNTMKVAVKEAPVLGQAELLQPADVIKYQYRKTPPKVEFGWKPIQKAQGYEVQLANDPDFVKIAANTNLKTTKYNNQLTAGQYYWRVRPLDEGQRGGEWSAARQISVEQLTSMPGLLFPAEKGTAVFDPDERRLMRFTWTKPDDVPRVRLVLARDPTFKDKTVGAELNATSALVKMKEDGVYYWYVTGEDRHEKLALKSPVQTFTVSTIDVEIVRGIEDRVRADIGYAPHQMSMEHTVDTLDPINEKLTFAYAAYASISGTLDQKLSFRLTALTRRADLTVPVGTSDPEDPGVEPLDSQEFTISMTDVTSAIGYQFKLWQKTYPTRLGVHLGYHFNNLITFYPGSGDYAGAYEMRNSRLHNVLLGTSLTVPLGSIFTLESKLDYIQLVSSYPVIFNKAVYLMSDVMLLHEFMGSGIMGYGVFYRLQDYAFTDETATTYEGTLSLNTIGLLYSLGYLF